MLRLARSHEALQALWLMVSWAWGYMYGFGALGCDVRAQSWRRSLVASLPQEQGCSVIRTLASHSSPGPVQARTMTLWPRMS